MRILERPDAQLLSRHNNPSQNVKQETNWTSTPPHRKSASAAMISSDAQTVKISARAALLSQNLTRQQVAYPITA